MKKILTPILFIITFNAFSCHKKNKEIPVPVIDVLKWMPDERYNTLSIVDILENIQYPEMTCEDEICI